MTAPQTPRDVCLGVLDGAEAHDYGSGFGSPGVARIGSPQAAKITDDLLAALAEAGYVVVRPEDRKQVANRERVAEALLAIPGFELPHEEHGYDSLCPLCRANAGGIADALIAADVFRDEAKAKAEALEQYAEECLYDGDTDQPRTNEYHRVLDRAAAIRDGRKAEAPRGGGDQ